MPVIILVLQNKVVCFLDKADWVLQSPEGEICLRHQLGQLMMPGIPGVLPRLLVIGGQFLMDVMCILFRQETQGRPTGKCFGMIHQEIMILRLRGQLMMPVLSVDLIRLDIQAELLTDGIFILLPGRIPPELLTGVFFD